MHDGPAAAPLRPAEFCRYLLEAIEVSEGRRRRRKRDTTPDAIGLGIKRTLLEAAVRDDPAPEAFEGWLLHRCLSTGPGSGGVRAMALSIWDEWRLARAAPGFRAWLAAGAPSDDRDTDARPPGACGAAGADTCGCTQQEREVQAPEAGTDRSRGPGTHIHGPMGPVTR